MGTRRVRVSAPGNVASFEKAIAAALDDALPVRQTNGRMQGVIVELDVPPLQRRRIHGLPSVRRPILRQIVIKQCERFFPRAAEGLTIDVLVPRTTQADAGVLAVAVDNRVATRVVELIESRGYAVMDIVPADRALQRLSLLPSGVRSRRNNEALRSTRKWACGVAVLYLMAGFVVPLGWRFWEGRLEAEIKSMVHVAEQSEVLNSARQLAAEEAMTVEASIAANDSLAVFLRTVAHAMPVEAVITSLRYERASRREVEILAREPSVILRALVAGDKASGWKVTEGPELVAVGDETWASVTFAGREPIRR